MTVGERIQSYRKLAGLSQEGLAEALGVSRQAVSKWELDVTMPEAEKLILLARTFKISLDELLGVQTREQEENDGDNAPPQSDNSGKNNRTNDFSVSSRRGIVGLILRLVEKKGYVAGYILIGYGLLVILMMGGFMLAVNAMLPSDQFFNGFGGSTGIPGMSDFPDVGRPNVGGAFRAILIVPGIGMLMGLAMIIGGIVVIVKFKPKGK